MRHHNSVRKFGREKNVRNALMKGLVLSLIKHERITTTEAKAKELRPMIEKLVTLGKKTKTIAGRRLIASRLYNSAIGTKKLVEEIAPKYEKRAGGYTRIMKLPPRLGDGSKMAIIEFI
jgi:large subunit ribosomal protein L17